MKRGKKIKLLFFCFIVGLLFFAVNQEWIVIRSFTRSSQVENTLNKLRSTKKQMTVSFWHQGKWNTEALEIITTADPAQTAQALVTAWLSLLDEEKITTNKISLQSALMSTHGQLYLSFDRSPFEDSSSTYDKWMWTESLLRTLRENCSEIRSVYLMVHHRPLEDDHLDFSNPWPVTGFQKYN